MKRYLLLVMVIFYAVGLLVLMGIVYGAYGTGGSVWPPAVPAFRFGEAADLTRLGDEYPDRYPFLAWWNTGYANWTNLAVRVTVLILLITRCRVLFGCLKGIVIRIRRWRSA